MKRDLVFTLLSSQERQLVESAKAEMARAAQKRDLRNKLNKRKLVVMNVAREDHLKLAQLFEVSTCLGGGGCTCLVGVEGKDTSS